MGLECFFPLYTLELLPPTPKNTLPSVSGSWVFFFLRVLLLCFEGPPLFCQIIILVHPALSTRGDPPSRFLRRRGLLDHPVFYPRPAKRERVSWFPLALLRREVAFSLLLLLPPSRPPCFFLSGCGGFFNACPPILIHSYTQAFSLSGRVFSTWPLWFLFLLMTIVSACRRIKEDGRFCFALHFPFPLASQLISSLPTRSVSFSCAPPVLTVIALRLDVTPSHLCCCPQSVSPVSFLPFGRVTACLQSVFLFSSHTPFYVSSPLHASLFRRIPEFKEEPSADASLRPGFQRRVVFFGL